MSEEKIKAVKARIAARKAVERIMEIIPQELEECELADEDMEIVQERFWEKLAEVAAARVGKCLIDDEPRHMMSLEEALRFDQTPVPQWSKYRGQIVQQVPDTYWLALLEGDFIKRLKRYVASKWFQDRQK